MPLSVRSIAVTLRLPFAAGKTRGWLTVRLVSSSQAMTIASAYVVLKVSLPLSSLTAVPVEFIPVLESYCIGA
jgi:hypothetical protein